MTNMFIYSRSSFENHSWFQTKMCKVYTLFQTETAAITLSFEAVHTYMASKREFNPWGFLPLDFFQLQNITRKL